ncbi:MAG TPA: hypothetical protein DCO65_00655 [Spartobacteria bacterium]|nr:hypothetical protein [Spartobacteria bacterium]
MLAQKYPTVCQLFRLKRRICFCWRLKVCEKNDAKQRPNNARLFQNVGDRSCLAITMDDYCLTRRIRRLRFLVRRFDLLMEWLVAHGRFFPATVATKTEAERFTGTRTEINDGRAL